MGFNITGLASGLDVETLISGLVNAANQPIRDLDTQRASVQAASQTLSSFSSRLSTLKTSAAALGNPSGAVWTTATSSDTSVTAQTSGSSLPGSYTIEVSNLAARQKTRSDEVTTSDTGLGQAGTLSIKYGSLASLDVTVSATDTLTQIATKINASGARVSASVVSDSGKYRLVLQGLDTGKDNKFTITETGTTLGLATTANTYQQAVDASFKVDNQPQTSSTNNVSVIAGVTLALVRPTTSAVTITVQTDGSGIKQKLQQLASAYNDIVNAGHTAAGFAGIKPTNTVLAGDSSIRGTLSHLRSAFTASMSGLTGRYRSLLDIGFKPGNDGTLTFDTATFDTALAKDPVAVQTILSGVGTQKGIMTQLSEEADKIANQSGGLVKAKADSLSARIRRIDDQKDKLTKQIVDYEATLRKQFTAMDTIVSRYKSMGSALAGIGNSGNSSSG